MELYRLAGAEDDCHLAGPAGFYAFGKTGQSCLVLLLLSFFEFLTHGVVHALDVFSLAGVDDSRLDDGFREVRDIGNTEAATARGENLLVKSLEVILAPGELHTERSLADSITHSPGPEVGDGVQPEGEADGSHLQRIAGRCCGTEQNAEVLSASGDEQFCVQAGAPLAFLTLIEDDERILRDVPDIAVAAAAALRQFANAHLFVVAHEDRLDAEPRCHRHPVGSGSLGGDDNHRLAEACCHGACDISLTCAGVAGIKGYSVLSYGCRNVVGVFFLVWEECNHVMQCRAVVNNSSQSEKIRVNFSNFCDFF